MDTWAIVNNAATSMIVQISLQVPVFILWGIHPNMELTDHMVTSVSFLRNYYTVFHKGCTILSSYLPRIPISLYPHQHFFFCLIGNFSVF